MIKVNELRLGSLFVSEGQYYYTIQISNNYVFAKSVNGHERNRFPVQSIDPIKITEQSLFFLGFSANKEGTEYTMNGFCSFKFHLNELCSISVEPHSYMEAALSRFESVFYVHQLQLLYFTLKGEELIQLPLADEKKPMSFFKYKWYVREDMNVEQFRASRSLANSNVMYRAGNCFDSSEDALFASRQMMQCLRDIKNGTTK